MYTDMHDYIMKIRTVIGQSPVLTVGVGCLIENESGELLLQKRSDNGLWGLPGGLMEFGETIIETAVREIYEETKLKIIHPELFGIYSGKEGYGEYPNGDKVFSIQILFRTNQYSGELQTANEESHWQAFFSREEMQELPFNRHQERLISDWMNGEDGIKIR